MPSTVFISNFVLSRSNNPIARAWEFNRLITKCAQDSTNLGKENHSKMPKPLCTPFHLRKRTMMQIGHFKVEFPKSPFLKYNRITKYLSREIK
jgi:hypothetical protein